MAAFTAAVTAYRKGYFNQELDFTDDSDWADFDARRLRYAVMGAYYNGNPYDNDLNAWSRRLKADHGLYQHARPIANPVYTLGQFYRTYIWGGRLDPDAGDDEETALPLVGLNDSYRPMVGDIWRWSNWSTRRDVVPLQGATLGDAIIQVVDDVESGKVYIKEVHPSKISYLDKDAFGNIKGYEIRYRRSDDLNATNEVEYIEQCTRDGDNVIFKLYKNGAPYAWDGVPEPMWSVPYGFVPMVHIQHRETPYGWGEPEIYPRLALVRELDDQYSLLNDQIRKTVNAPWIVSGETKESFTDAQFTDPTTGRPQPMREEALLVFLANPESDMKAMVTELAIDQVRENIATLRQMIEDDYPELAVSKIRELAQMTGVAVRRLQQPAENKVQSYRDVYDGALVKVLQMALSIGGYRGLFSGINLNSYESGALDFSIGKRAVFNTDVLDDLEVKQAQANVLSTMSNVGNLQAAVRHVYGEDDDLAQQLSRTDEEVTIR